METLKCPECGEGFANNPRGFHTHRRIHGMRRDEIAMKVIELTAMKKKAKQIAYGKAYRERNKSKTRAGQVDNQTPSVQVAGQPRSHANYCPSCGCNMKAVSLAMKLSQ